MAAALLVVHHHTTGLLVAIAFVLFTVASTATVGLMFLYYSRHPGEAQTKLATYGTGWWRPGRRWPPWGCWWAGSWWSTDGSTSRRARPGAVTQTGLETGRGPDREGFTTPGLDSIAV